MPRCFKLTVAYDGTDFAGWQVQLGQPTIQQSIQDALGKIVKEPIRVIGSGRTDAGVHAIGQVASCQIPRWNATADDLKRAVNSRLPDTIVIRDVTEKAEGFHAIANAVSKRYRYQMQIGGDRDVFEFRYRWRLHGQIDLAAIREAASRFVGKHDFASFQAAGSSIKKTTVRNVSACELIAQNRSAAGGAGHFALEVEADGFLYNMVRNIVGTLVEVGRGKYGPDRIDEILEARDRDVAGPTAPPHGLFLVRVDYDTEHELRPDGG